MEVMMKSHKVSAAASKARQQPGRATHLRSGARPSTAFVRVAGVRAAGAGTAAAAAAAAAAPRVLRHQRSSGGLACRASPEHAEGPSARDIAEDPAAALAKVTEHILAGDLDALLEFVPDEVIDRVIEMRRCATGGGEPSWLRFADILQATAGAGPPYLDSYAVRHLALGAPPRALAPLSAARASPDRYLQRCAATAGAGGEEATLTFEMVRQECLENQYRGPPLVRKRWMLRSVRGEPAPHGAPLRAPSPLHAPEAVLAEQLSALRDQRFSDVFAHASPANKRATGPVAKFARMLHAPAYAPLLGHARAETLQRLQPSPAVFMELVRVYPAQPQPPSPQAPPQQQQQPQHYTYLWVLSRQAEGSGDDAGCWMVDSVQPVEPAAPPGFGFVA